MNLPSVFVWSLVAALVWGLAGCSSSTVRPAASGKQASGGYYLDDGPGENPPADLDAIPDAVPRQEPLHRFANRSYVVFGKTYVPMTERGVYREEGVASWYGRRFHGRRTSSGENYDMYAMTAAHPTLPIPSYARVTSIDSGRSVVVRINDRGPFHKERLIDVSYVAAHKLGFVARGSGRVRVESIDPEASSAAAGAAGGIFVQVGAFSQPDNARQLREQLLSQLSLEQHRVRIVQGGPLHRVRIGPYGSEAAAQADLARMQAVLALRPVLIQVD